MSVCIFGCDPARFGEDSTIIYIRKDNIVTSLAEINKMDTMFIVGEIKRFAKIHKPDIIYVDEIGIGSGIVDRLAQLGLPVYGINVAKNAYNDKDFHNLRAELFWNMREKLNPQNNYNYIIPNDDELIQELANVHYEYDNINRIKIEKTEMIKKRIGRSPDKATALMLVLIDDLDYNNNDNKAMSLEGIGNIEY